MNTETNNNDIHTHMGEKPSLKVPVKKRKCCDVEYSKGMIGNQGCSRGKHNHKSEKGAIDHATGTDFLPDKSTTKAVKNRMRALGIKWEGM